MGGGKKLRGEMTPLELEVARRQAKYTDCLLKSGRPTRIPAAPAVEHLAALAARGMDPRDMAEQSGLSLSTCRDLVRGRRPDKHDVPGKPLGKIYRDTVERALTVTFAEPVLTDGKYGPTINGTGTARRIQGLIAKGFSVKVIAEALDASTQYTHQLATRRFPMTATKTARLVAEVYDKFQHVDPLDYGLTQWAVSRAKSAARKHGFVPPEVWDEDTIDDPNALPEWTGQCGTQEGWVSHHLFEIPMCPPCEGAVTFDKSRTRERLGEVQGRYEFDATEVVAAMNRRQLTGNALEMELGLTKGLMSRWLSSASFNPSWKSGLKLAAFLDLSWTDIYVRKESS